jgi:hypothetical protein
MREAVEVGAKKFPLLPPTASCSAWGSGQVLHTISEGSEKSVEIELGVTFSKTYMKSVSFWEQLLIAEALRFVGENW